MYNINKFYKNYYHDDPGHNYIINEIIKFIPSNSKILDAGCGTGKKSKNLMGNNNSIIGIDFSISQIRDATKVLDFAMVADIYALPFKNEAFDVVYCSMVLEHLFYVKEALIECQRVLKKGGKIIIEVPNLNYWPNRILMLLGKELIWIGVGKHIRAFNKFNLKKMLYQCGYKNIKIIGSILPIPKTKMKIYLPYFN